MLPAGYYAAPKLAHLNGIDGHYLEGSGTMAGFERESRDGVVLWRGVPDCQSAHDAMVDWLRTNLDVSFRTSLPADDHSRHSLVGNVGECIAFYVAIFNGYADHRAFCANAWNPFATSSNPFIDIVWLRLAPDRKDDVAVIQEIKTTGGASLDYASALLTDYDKLFGSNEDLMLHNRLQGIKKTLRFQHHEPPAVYTRLNTLAGDSPSTSSGIRLLPTLVHDAKSADPVAKMVGIRSSLVGRGWDQGAVEPWAIRLSDLIDRIMRLTVGRS